MSDLNSPMVSRPFNEEGRGGNHPGIKDGVALGRPGGTDAVSSPLNNPIPSHKGISTAGGPVGIQVTEAVADFGAYDVHPIEGRQGAFPSGTASKA